MKLIIPGEPTGKARPRVTKQGIAYTPKKTVNYETLVQEIYAIEHGNKRLEGQISALIIAYFSIPKSASKKKRQAMIDGQIRPTKKPDWDNIGKIICDSLNKLAYDDDSGIVDGTVKKYYSDNPRVEVYLEEAS
ncbi:MAG TPA: RusA family crossover junction endodeoxyribonuclease [Syntrophomonas wolfei]|uniref:RusA family crossover junction endodeoxyribonuclease n=1 Tax=Syntrophomonas wolfei TaxID=863 RepID=A0A354YVN8_9FIRM|nr:RusA family crossover junction endodeoxyribonuclease [Syntrophomonas wolfei]